MDRGKDFPDARGQRKSGKKLIERKNELRAAAGRPFEPRKDLVAPGRPMVLNRKTGKPQLRGGQPSLIARFDIDPTIIVRLAAQCYSDKEIASLIPCDVRTLRKHFSDYLKQGHYHLNAKLKIRAYQMAMGGCVPLLIFLLEHFDRMFDPNGRPPRAARPKARSLKPKKTNSLRRTPQPRGLKRFQDEMKPDQAVTRPRRSFDG